MYDKLSKNKENVLNGTDSPVWIHLIVCLREVPPGCWSAVFRSLACAWRTPNFDGVGVSATELTAVVVERARWVY